MISARLSRIRILKVALIALLLFACVSITITSTACMQTAWKTLEREADGTTHSDGLRVLASIFAPYDFAREILGGIGEVRMLVPPGVEVHSFEPTARDIIALQQSDVFVYVGGESDEWIERILESMDTSKIRLIRLVDCVDLLDEIEFDAQSDPHKDNSFDEHVWTNPLNAIRIVQQLVSVFSTADADHADVYYRNGVAYSAKLEALDSRFRDIVATSNRTTLVFGDRFPFRYFADEYGLASYAAFPGCSTATEVSAKTMSLLIDTIRAQSIPVVFYVEGPSHRIAEAICEETGAVALLLHACHTISKDDFASGVTYIDLMEANAENLSRALR